jgi:hypothetical protein
MKITERSQVCFSALEKLKKVLKIKVTKIEDFLGILVL